MPIAFYQVDAFTATRFKGNPAAVCLLEDPLADELMQSIAAEFGLSETAFIWPEGGVGLQKPPEYRIRWFTPKVEVPLCAHATLAASAVILNELRPQLESVVFQSRSGQLVAIRSAVGITLDFPADSPEPVTAPAGLMEALGVHDCLDIIRGRRTGKLVIRVARPDEVRCLQPDFAAMIRLQSDVDMKGVAVTASAEGRYDFISRYFNPWAGVNEDPVTGSVHTVLGPYWGHLLGKSELIAHQASARGGELRIVLIGDGRLEISGQTVIVSKGQLFV